MRYLCLLYVPEGDQFTDTPEYASLAAANVAARAAMAAAGVLVDCAPLHPVSSATTVQIRGGETVLTDGPYAELKEQIGGYYLLECAELDEALRWAGTIPAAGRGAVEVRPVVEVRGVPGAGRS
jgi:hypothetical protein